MKAILRHEVVGKYIWNVVCRWEHEDDLSVASVFVDVGESATRPFLSRSKHLVSLDPKGGSLVAVNAHEEGLKRADGYVIEACRGKQICEVMTGSYFIGIGLLLDSSALLFFGECGLKTFGPCVSSVQAGNDDHTTELTPFVFQA